MNTELTNILATQNVSLHTQAPDTQSTIACNLNHFGLLKISGDDAQDFLQGQFSNDVKALDGKNSQLSSYNNPKGRMLASFRLFKWNDDYFMRLPIDVLEKTQKRLTMFIMRSKVTITEASANFIGLGFSGSKAPSLLEQAQIPLPQNTNGILAAHGLMSLAIDVGDSLGNDLKVSKSPTRYEVYGSAKVLQALIAKIKNKIGFYDSKSWRYFDIIAGIPNIYESTMEEFVPQMINYDVIGGISFNKGCYTGQEIVARMHYLGNLKKRMYLCHIETDQNINLNDKIYEANTDKKQSVGQIVDVLANTKNGLDALCVLQISSVDNKLSVNEANGPNLELKDLPYELKE